MAKVFKLTSDTSILKKKLHYELDNSDNNLSIGLVAFYSTYLTPNVKTAPSGPIPCIGYGDKTVWIPEGQYSLKSFSEYLESQSVGTTLTEDRIRNRVEIETDENDFYITNLDVVLGFRPYQILEKNKTHIGSKLPKFHPFDTINVHCNVADGMIVKDSEYTHRETGTIATFKTAAEFKHSIIYEPSYPLFFPITRNKIDEFEIKITDENDSLIDFGGAQTTVLLQTKIFY